ncbi:PspA/IM30 family protein [Pajaroellobacter abortibovis]|uniref:Phage shock protein A n=1 Tax=Pajaroellobacter abortibovis TaxID=1882918 RepID=A0A1L6MVR6_9BACT|nr:PspA/IM30 family protein [Pajaroellobacter abortibovis]APR99578.1 hypothetical protein BCY86_01940 [Pajaroellobacter abortibovis]
MGIFERVGKVISSNIHHLLHQMEDPKKLFNLTLEEMREALLQRRQDVIKAIATEKQLRKKEEELAAEIARWEKRAELALEQENEFLAAEAIKHKKRISDTYRATQTLALQAQEAAQGLQHQIQLMEQHLRGVELRHGTLTVQAGKGREGEGALGEFERMEECIEEQEAEAHALHELNRAFEEEAMGTTQLEEAFRYLEQKQQGLEKTGGKEKTEGTRIRIE